jgi:hypothetical protein
MPDTIDERLITSITQSEYFRYLVEKEVAKQTDEKLSAWWKTIVAATGIILAALGIFGAREILSLNAAKIHIESMEQEINGKVKDLNLQLKDLDAKREEVRIALIEAKALSEIAGASLKGSQDLTKEGLQLMGGASKIVAESRLAIEDGLLRQQQIATSAEKSLETIDKSRARFDTALKDIEKTDRTVQEARIRIEGDAEKIGTVLALRDDLGKAKLDLEKAKTFTYFMLEEGDTRKVVLGGKEIWFSIDDITELIALTVQVEAQSGPPSGAQTVKNLVQGRVFLINGTDNLYCEVTAVRYRKIGPDFAFFKVFAR